MSQQGIWSRNPFRGPFVLKDWSLGLPALPVGWRQAALEAGAVGFLLGGSWDVVYGPFWESTGVPVKSFLGGTQKLRALFGIPQIQSWHKVGWWLVLEGLWGLAATHSMG